MKTKSMLAAFVAAVFGTMMFAAPAMAGGNWYPPPPSDSECIPEHVVHHDAIPETFTTVHHDAVPETTTTIHHDAVPGPWWNWAPNDSQGPQDYVPGFPTDERGTWEGPHTVGGPQQDMTGTFQTGGGNSPFFHRAEGTAAFDEIVGNGDGQDAWDEQVGNGDGQDAWDETIPATGDCDEDVPVAVAFNIEPTPATCDEDGFLDTTLFPIEREGYTLTVDRVFDGPGDYTITATAADGFTFSGEGNPFVRTAVVTVGERLPADSDECYSPPPPPEVCEDGQIAIWHTWTGGPVGSDEGPAANAEGWNANSGNPQSAVHRFSDHTAGVPYFVSNGNSGNGDWFLWTVEDCPTTPAEVTPTNPVPDDQCGTDNDGYLLPEDSADITYAMGEDGSITATLTSDDVVFGSVPEGWASTDDAAALVWVGFSEDFTDEPCVGTPTGIPFSVTPEPASCDAAGSFDAASLGGAFNEETGQWEFENVDAEVLFDNPEDGDVTINLFAHEGFIIEATPEQLADGWFVEAGGARASLTITLEQRLTVNPETGLPCQFSAPIETAPQIVQIDACGVLNDGWDTVNEVGITYTQEGSVITATADEGYVLIASNGWTGSDGVTATLDLEAVFVWNDAPCTTTTTPGVTPVNNVLAVTTPSQARTLAATGSNGILGLGALAALLLVMGGSAAAVAARRK